MMRTTLTLDDEASLGLLRLRKKHPDKSFKELVNEVIKKGLAANGEQVKVAFKIRAKNNAKPKSGVNFDCISSMISSVEGDFHK